MLIANPYRSKIFARYFTLFSLVIRPLDSHSKTYKLPSASQRGQCGEINSPSTHCSGGTGFFPRLAGSGLSPRWVITLLFLNEIPPSRYC